MFNSLYLENNSNNVSSQAVDNQTMSSSLYLENSNCSSNNNAYNNTGSIANKNFDQTCNYNKISYFNSNNNSSNINNRNYSELYLNDDAMYTKEAGSVCEFLSNRLGQQTTIIDKNIINNNNNNDDNSCSSNVYSNNNINNNNKNNNINNNNDNNSNNKHIENNNRILKTNNLLSSIYYTVDTVTKPQCSPQSPSITSLDATASLTSSLNSSTTTSTPTVTTTKTTNGSSGSKYFKISPNLAKLSSSKQIDLRQTNPPLKAELYDTLNTADIINVKFFIIYFFFKNLIF